MLTTQYHMNLLNFIIMCFSNKISKRCKWLLKKVSIGACFLTCEEIARAIKFLLPEYEKLAHNIILSIYGMLSSSSYTEKLKNAKRKTLVLIIDEVSIHTLRHDLYTQFLFSVTFCIFFHSQAYRLLSI